MARLFSFLLPSSSLLSSVIQSVPAAQRTCVHGHGSHGQVRSHPTGKPDVCIFYVWEINPIARAAALTRKNWVEKKGKKGLYVLLSRSQAGPGRNFSQPPTVQTLFPLCTSHLGSILCPRSKMTSLLMAYCLFDSCLTVLPGPA